MTHIIAISSSKGGVGKSTLSMQIAIFLNKKGKNVCVLDCDAQGTVSSYLVNREKNNLETPKHLMVTDNLQNHINVLSKDHEIIIIDTPGGKFQIVDEVHNISDTVITVLNNSFVDLDVLVKISDPVKYTCEPGIYSQDLWEARKLRLYAKQTQKWLLVLNRVGCQTKNHDQVVKVIKDIAQKWGMQFGGMIRERVGYRDGFLYGRTPLDPQPQGLNASHIAARQEIRQIIGLLGIA